MALEFGDGGLRSARCPRRSLASSFSRLPRQAAAFPIVDLLLMVGRWIWALPIVTLVWWLVRKLPRDTEESPEPEWCRRPLFFHLDSLDKLSLGILATLWLLLWLGRNTIFPVPPDSYYHLLVARHVYEAGAVPLWDSWEWAPLGRPHLYPPLYHVLLASLAGLLNGDLLAAFRILLTIVLPFTYFTTWYLARWLFDARRAFVALLIVGMDGALVFSAAMGTPGVLATSFVSLMLVLFLTERYVAASILGALAAYTHLGVPSLSFVGLGLFCLLNRRYLPHFFIMMAIVVLTMLPWLARIFVFHDWFSHPIDLGVYGEFEPWIKPLIKISWLQMVHLFIALLAFAALTRVRWRERRNQLLACSLVALLPVLFSYGGRFYIHTLHIWAILAACLFTGLLAPPLRWRRVAILGLLALCPAPALVGTGTPLAPGVYPVPSAWVMAPPVAMGALRYLEGGKALGFASFENCQNVADIVRQRTRPDQILYFSWDRDLALPVGFLSHRSVDVGAWEETMPTESQFEMLRWYAFHDPTACYISREPYGVPYGIEKELVGDLYVGFRTGGDREGISGKPPKRAGKPRKRLKKRGGENAAEDGSE